MKFSVAHLIFIVLMLTLLECVLCYNYGRDDDPTVDQRLDRLENKVEILTNEVDKLISESENPNDGQGESAQQQLLGVTVLEVRREEEGEAIRFTVKYDSGEETVETRWINYYLEEEYSGINAAVGGGVYETTALFSRLPADDNDDGNSSIYFIPESILFSLELPDHNEYLTLGLNVTDHYAIQREIPTPRLDIEPDGDFVYQDGEDFSFKIRIDLASADEDGPSSRMRNFDLTSVLLDPTTGKVSLNYADDDIFQIGEKKKFQNYEEVIARIKGTDNGVSGLVNIVSRMETYDGGVVNTVERGKLVILRPSTQDGPFPDGYLGVVEKPNHVSYGHTANGSSDVFVCRLDEICYYECMVAGNDIADVTVKRIKADGTSQTLRSKELSEVLPYISRKAVTFHADSILEQPDKLLCVADNAEGTFISKEVTISVSAPVAIVREDSRIVMISREEDVAVFEIACTVKGYPQPNVTFNIYMYYASNKEYFGYPDVVLDKGDYTYTMIKTVTYDAVDLYGRSFYMHVDCTANRNDPYWGYDNYVMTYG